MKKQDKISDFELEKLVIKTFKEYGGWWTIEGMANWLGTPMRQVKAAWDKLTSVGLMERK